MQTVCGGGVARQLPDYSLDGFFGFWMEGVVMKLI
jgi:hypothetical protein